MALELRDYQADAVTATMVMWGDGEQDALIIAPCGAGKSIIIAETVRQCIEYPNTRVLILTHRKELLSQNSAELRALLPGAPIGFWSAGLKKKDKTAQVLFAGIASIEKHIYGFDPFQIVIVDESHMVSNHEQSQYQKVLKALRLLNPNVRFLHLTATPYRLDSGHLPVPVAYEIKMQMLIDRGYLLPIVSKAGALPGRADLSNVHKRGGEFIAGEMQDAFNEQALIDAACDEVVALGSDRRAWMLFTAGVDHAERVHDAMIVRGINGRLITGKTPVIERDESIAQFKAGELKYLVNCEVLTIGINAPICDLIAMMRATESAALYVQIAGRGQRRHPGKTNCLYLDYGGNVERLGFIDAPIIKTPGNGGGEAPVKECLNCHSFCPAGCRECPDCGHPFPAIVLDHAVTAYAGAMLKSQVQPEWVTVDSMEWNLHQKADKPDSVRVSYYCGMAHYTEYLCVCHEGYAGRKSRALVMTDFLPKSDYVGELPYLEMLDDANTLLNCYIMAREPKRILIEPDGKYIRVISREF